MSTKVGQVQLTRRSLDGATSSRLRLIVSRKSGRAIWRRHTTRIDTRITQEIAL